MSEQINQVIEQIRTAAGDCSKIVFVSGNFNVVHPGHLRLLNFAAECGDFLVVGVNSDNSENALIPVEMRLEGIRSIGIVDFALQITEPAEDFVGHLRPAVVVKGKEHENDANPEQKVLDNYGGKLLFSSGEVRFSSLDLLQRELRETDLTTIRKPSGFLQRHGFDMPNLIALVNSFTELKVVVVGDLIVDEYISCEPLGMSREDPTLVVSPIHSDRFVGGAGIVAAHARGLGATVSYVTVVGVDETAQYAKEQLAAYGVDAHLVVDENRPTTLKQRFRAQGKTLLRVSRLQQNDISQEVASDIYDRIAALLSDTDLLIFSDFNYGALPQALVDRLVFACEANDVMMVADSQSSSQVGDVSRFKGMRLLTPTEHEARLAIRDFNSGLVVLAEALRQQAQANKVIVKLGAEGLLLHAPNGDNSELITDRLPAFNTAPKDVSGAGDSLLVAAALALASGADIWRSTYLGSVAAACQVGRVGNLPLTAREIIKELSM